MAFREQRELCCPKCESCTSCPTFQSHGLRNVGTLRTITLVLVFGCLSVWTRSTMACPRRVKTVFSALRKDCSLTWKHWISPVLRSLLQENVQTRSQRESPSLNSESEVCQTISFPTKHLNTKEVRGLDHKRALSGLRNTAEAISRLLRHIELGTILAALFKNILRHSSRLRELLVLLCSG